MFDVGFWEILLILILALVVIGPERLPGAARKAGYFFGKARRYIEGVRSEVESELDVGEFKRMLHNQEVQINELQQQLKAGVEDVKAEMPEDPLQQGNKSDSYVLEEQLPGEHTGHPDEVADEAAGEATDNKTVTGPAADKTQATDKT